MTLLAIAGHRHLSGHHKAAYERIDAVLEVTEERVAGLSAAPRAQISYRRQALEVYDKVIEATQPLEGSPP